MPLSSRPRRGRREAAEKAREGQAYSRAYDFYERGIEAAPSDQRAYLGLGQFYTYLGDLDRAIQTWRRGLKEVKAEDDRIGLNLDLAEALIQQGRLRRPRRS